MTKVKVKGTGPIVGAKFIGRAKQIFSDLNKTKNLVLLSIAGNEFCHAPYLEAMTKESINTYGETTFLIADEIYWHNLKTLNTTEMDIPILKEQALRLGDDYIEKNLAAFLAPLEMTINDFEALYPNLSSDDKITTINKLAQEKSLQFKIVRWATWMEDGRTSKIFDPVFQRLYNSNPQIKKSIGIQAASYAARHANEITEDVTRELLIQRSTGYLTEESAAIMLLGAEQGYNFIVYPGDLPASFAIAKKEFLKDVDDFDNSSIDNHVFKVIKPDLLVNWLTVHFNRQQEKKSEINPSAFFKAVNNEVASASPESKEQKISAVWEGVTAGILNTPSLSVSAKVEILAALLLQYHRGLEKQYSLSPPTIEADASPKPTSL